VNLCHRRFLVVASWRITFVLRENLTGRTRGSDQNCSKNQVFDTRMEVHLRTAGKPRLTEAGSFLDDTLFPRLEFIDYLE
jgi:hypothetical protein